MKRLILITTGGLVLTCVAGVGVLLVLNTARSAPNIHGIPIYPGAANAKVQDLYGFSTNNKPQVVTRSTHILGGGPVISGSPYPNNGNVYVGYMYFTSNDSTQQIYSYYDGLFTNAGWTSLIAIGKQTVTSSPGGYGLSGPRSYTYDPTPFRLPFMSTDNPAIITVRANSLPGGIGSVVSLILDRNTH